VSGGLLWLVEFVVAGALLWPVDFSFFIGSIFQNATKHRKIYYFP
jgi:hypothetical protein